MFILVTIRGVTIRASLSAVLGFMALLFILANAYFPGTIPQERSQTYWSVAFLTTLCLYLSVVAHEMGHALVATARGVPVSSVNLIMFSGTSDIKREGQRPLDEALINAAGPAVSLVLAALALVALVTIPSQSRPLVGFLELVLILNTWLGVFNLLPTMPLDGGQALRGFLWHRIGDYRRATHIASLVGRGLAGLLFVCGVGLLVVSLDPSRAPIPALLTYDSRIVALVIILVAWFLNTGARNAYRHAVTEQWFRGVPVSR